MSQAFIRLATPSDVAPIIAIWKCHAHLGNGNHPSEKQCLEFSERLAAAIHDTSGNAGRCWVAIASGALVGWQSLLECTANPFFRQRQLESSTYTIRRSGVPNLGQLLLGIAVEYAVNSSVEIILGFVRSNNHASLRMMRACRFRKIGNMPLANDTFGITTEVWYFDATQKSLKND